MEKPTISALPDHCLQTIFLNLPILKRIEVRKVCKRWKRISDDCWRHIRGIGIINEFPDSNYAVEENGVININALKARFAIGFIKRCASYITSVEDIRNHPVASILPAMKSCTKIEELTVTLSSAAHDKHLATVLASNRQIRSLTVRVQGTSLCKGLEHLSTDYLEEFLLHIKYDLADNDDVLLARSAKQIIRNAPLLKSVTVSDRCDLLLEEIGRKVNLELLNIVIYYTDAKLDHMFKLVNLRSLSIGLPLPVEVMSDEFLENLSTSCLHLEVLRINPCYAVTDSGLLAISHLPKLKELCLENASKITDQYLRNFSKIESLKITHSEIEDPGTIALLRNSPNLKYLNLTRSNITAKSVRVAIDEAGKRTNNIHLDFDVKDTKVDMSELDDLAPLLNNAR